VSSKNLENELSMVEQSLEQPRPTMRDVARRAGVSLASVSYVLNGGPRPVSEALRQRVAAAMEELGYRPARRGRSRSRPLTVGIVVPEATNSFFAQALAGIESVLRAGGHVALATSSGDDTARERDLVAACVRARVDGLILTPSEAVPEEVERLAAGGLPVVLMDREGGGAHFDRVVMDNYRSAFQATRLLIESGHRRVALVNGPRRVSTAAERLRGYRDALAFAGLPAVDDHVRSGPFAHEQGREATLDLLSLSPRPDAIFSSSVILTSGVLHALRERGLRWPDDIAVVGFGDAAWVPVMTPPLTVIQQPARQLGEVAARLLLAGTGRPQAGQRVVLDAQLILRESHWRPAPSPTEVVT
jgi:LacI family transcriptional regulator